MDNTHTFRINGIDIPCSQITAESLQRAHEQKMYAFGERDRYREELQRIRNEGNKITPELFLHNLSEDFIHLWEYESGGVQARTKTGYICDYPGLKLYWGNRNSNREREITRESLAAKGIS